MTDEQKDTTPAKAKEPKRDPLGPVDKDGVERFGQKVEG